MKNSTDLATIKKQCADIGGKRTAYDFDIEKRVKSSGQDVKESEAGIELLRKMKATKREDATGYQALELEKAQKAAEIEAQRLKARSAATDEAQISMAEGKAGEQLTELSKMKQAKALTEDQMMALSAKDSAAVAAALKEKYSSQQTKEQLEQRLKDQQVFVDRMATMEDKNRDQMERILGKSLEQMGQTASTRATAGSTQGTTVVAGGGFGAPVVVAPGGGAAPVPIPQPPQKVILCRKCNAELDPTEKFCNTCGEKVQP